MAPAQAIVGTLWVRYLMFFTIHERTGAIAALSAVNPDDADEYQRAVRKVFSSFDQV